MNSSTENDHIPSNRKPLIEIKQNAIMSQYRTKRSSIDSFDHAAKASTAAVPDTKRLNILLQEKEKQLSSLQKRLLIAEAKMEGLICEGDKFKQQEREVKRLLSARDVDARLKTIALRKAEAKLQNFLSKDERKLKRSKLARKDLEDEIEQLDNELEVQFLESQSQMEEKAKYYESEISRLILEKQESSDSQAAIFAAKLVVLTDDHSTSVKEYLSVIDELKSEMTLMETELSEKEASNTKLSYCIDDLRSKFEMVALEKTRLVEFELEATDLIAGHEKTIQHKQIEIEILDSKLMELRNSFNLTVSLKTSLENKILENEDFHKNEFANIRKELFFQNSQYDDLLQSKKTADAKIVSLEASLLKVQAECDRRQAIEEENKIRTQRLEEVNIALECDLKTANKNIALQNESLICIQKQLAERNISNESLETKISTLQQVICNLELNIHSLTNENQEIKLESKGFSIKYSDACLEIERLKNEHFRHEEIIGHKNNENLELSQRNFDSSNEIKLKNDEVRGLQIALTAKDHENTSFQVRLDEASISVKNLSSRVEASKQENLKLTAQLGELLLDLNELKKKEQSAALQIDVLTKELQLAQTNKKDIVSSLDISSKRLADLEQSNAAELSKVKEESNVQCRELKIKISSQEDIIETLAKEKLTFQFEIDCSKNTIEKNILEIEKLNSSLNEKESQIIASDIDASNFSKERDIIASELSVQITEKNRLKQALETLHNMQVEDQQRESRLITEKNADIQRLQDEVTKAKTDFYKLSEENSNLLGHSNIKQKIQHLSILKTQLKELIEENGMLRTQLTRRSVT